MADQGNLFDDIPEARFWESVIASARKNAKKRTPYQLQGESKEEFDEVLRDNVRLEFCHLLRLIADDIEQKTLARQKHTIKIIWETKGAIE